MGAERLTCRVQCDQRLPRHGAVPMTGVVAQSRASPSASASAAAEVVISLVASLTGIRLPMPVRYQSRTVRTSA